VRHTHQVYEIPGRSIYVWGGTIYKETLESTKAWSPIHKTFQARSGLFAAVVGTAVRRAASRALRCGFRYATLIRDPLFHVEYFLSCTVVTYGT